MLLTYQQIIDAVHAHTALSALGMRNRSDNSVPAILHTDHSATLIRVARDAAAILAPALAEIGLKSITADPVQAALVADFDPEPANPDLVQMLLIQAIKAKILHIAYSAALQPSGFYEAEAAAIIRRAVDIGTAAPAVAKLRRWPV